MVCSGVAVLCRWPSVAMAMIFSRLPTGMLTTMTRASCKS